MNLEQKIFYKEIIKYVFWIEENKPIPKTEFPKFLDSKAGCSTTALAALLYEGSCTAYSLFRISIEENNTNLQSNIKLNSSHAELIRNELPMINKVVLECIDLFLRQICEKDEPFGEKLFIEVGNFRQVAPAIKGARKSTTINASIKTSYL
ncbi:19990_t:CDS:2 [Gigaspora margarita]|uniref:ATP-dependent DNA helicase n=1 Tax=Gigaspora margarita TaxID=4874 RepID=A0ABN7W071_GIGMA|nr:19990_t:CDS:2 [Gigaspora margarita]